MVRVGQPRRGCLSRAVPLRHRSFSPNEHVTFGGGGPHFCLGASLAPDGASAWHLAPSSVRACPGSSSTARWKSCIRRCSSVASSTCPSVGSGPRWPRRCEPRRSSRRRRPGPDGDGVGSGERRLVGTAAGFEAGRQARHRRAFRVADVDRHDLEAELAAIRRRTASAVRRERGPCHSPVKGTTLDPCNSGMGCQSRGRPRPDQRRRVADELSHQGRGGDGRLEVEGPAPWARPMIHASVARRRTGPQLFFRCPASLLRLPSFPRRRRCPPTTRTSPPSRVPGAVDLVHAPYTPERLDRDSSIPTIFEPALEVEARSEQVSTAMSLYTTTGSSMNTPSRHGEADCSAMTGLPTRPGSWCRCRWPMCRLARA